MRTERKDVGDTKEREVCAVDCDGKDTALVDEEQRRAVQCTDLGLY